MTILSTARGRAGPAERVVTDVRSLRVSSTHALRGRLSRRSEISSMGDWVGLVGATSGLGRKVLLGFVVLSDFGTGVCLGPVVILGVDFAVLPFEQVVTATFRVGAITGSGGGVESVWIALTTQPPRTTWLKPGPRISCSAIGSAHFAFGVAGLGVLPSLLRTTGDHLASAAFASFHFTQPQ
jgi:hypothetical protein